MPLLLLELLYLLLQSLYLIAEVDHVLEHVEIFVLHVQKVVDEVVKLFYLCGGLNLGKVHEELAVLFLQVRVDVGFLQHFVVFGSVKLVSVKLRHTQVQILVLVGQVCKISGFAVGLGQLRETLQLVFKILRLALGLRLKVLDLVVRLVSLLVGVVGSLDDFRHFFAFVVQLLLKLPVQVVENYSLSAKRINILPQASVH